jgi:nitroimidazol reductase NimA-like FMN-containing flavoprotein (pyridoxamine 5'-phosphate oxidase superfamily)
MATTDPTPDEVEQAIAELLREQELGALATLGPSGAPSVSMMHFASDGLTVYLHTFTYNRKFAAIQRDPRVGYTVAHVPPGGFHERRQLRSVQVDGIATVVTDSAEIDRAIQVSHEQFDWLQDTSMYDTFRNGAAHHQAFFRIDPVQALWNDNRVRLLWRRIVTFTANGKHIAGLKPYHTARADTALAENSTDDAGPDP